MTFEPEDLFDFRKDCWDWEACRQWAFLADGENDALAWMQSIDRPEVARRWSARGVLCLATAFEWPGTSWSRWASSRSSWPRC